MSSTGFDGVWARFGRYGIDYVPAEYPRLSATAEEALRQGLVRLVGQGRDVVVDFSFWQRAGRERYKRLVEAAGGSWRLAYLKVDRALLREQLDDRAQRFDANAAFAIGEDLLATYLAGFEQSDGENEEVIRQDADLFPDGRPDSWVAGSSGIQPGKTAFLFAARGRSREQLLSR